MPGAGGERGRSPNDITRAFLILFFGVATIAASEKTTLRNTWASPHYTVALSSSAPCLIHHWFHCDGPVFAVSLLSVYKIRTKPYSPGTWLVSVLMGAVAFDGTAETVSTPKRFFGLGDVQRIAVSLDHRFMATAGQGGAVLWNFQTGERLRRLETEWAVTALAFSPDGETLLGADRGDIRAWSTGTGELRRVHLGHSGEINDLQFSASGGCFVSASADNTARVWSSATGAELHRVETPGASIAGGVLAPDERHLVTSDSSWENGVKIWDIANEALVRFLPRTNWSATRLLFSPGGQLITAATDRSVALWEIESGELIRSFAGVGSPALWVQNVWLPNDSTLAAAGNDGRIFAWNIDTGENLGVVPGETSIVAAGVPGEFQAVSAHVDYTLHVHEMTTGSTLRTFAGHTTSTHSAAAFSPNGRYLVSGGTEAATRLWDRHTGAPVRTLVGSGSGTTAGAFTPDGSNVLTTVGLPNPAVQLWRTETGELVREFKWTGSWPMSAALSKDGTRVAAGAQDERVRLFDTARGTLLRTIGVPGWVRSLSFSPNGLLVAAGSSDSSAHVFNALTGQRLTNFLANAGAVVAVAFAPDGGTLLVAWNDGLVRLFNGITFELLGDIGVPAFLESAAFSPDGNYLLTGEGWPLFTATIWDARTRESLRTFAGHKAPVGAVAFSPTGASILTAGEVVREWSTADLAARLRHERAPEHLQLSWSFGRLQRAMSLDGPWEPFPDITSPFRAPIGGTSGYFRVVAEPEE